MIALQPQAGYAYKTSITRVQSKESVKRSPSYKIGTRLYINICHSDTMPAPRLATETEIRSAMMAHPEATYRIPLTLGAPRGAENNETSNNNDNTDKHGKNTLIVDACIHTLPFVRSQRDLDFRLYVMELAMEHIEEALSVEISREFSMVNADAVGKPIPKWYIPPQTDDDNHGIISKITDAVQTDSTPLLLPVIQDVTYKPSSYQPPVFTRKDTTLTTVLKVSAEFSESWTVYIGRSRLLIKGLDRDKDIDISLPEAIDTNSKKNCVNFYAKTGHLVVMLTTAK